MNRSDNPAPFVFSRQGRFAEPHIVIVPGRKALGTQFNVDGAEIIEIPYPGGGWDKFVTKACNTLGILRGTMQLLTEHVFERSLKTPHVIFITNAKALLVDCPEELLRYVLFWERFSFDRRDSACPMFLALQMPDAGESVSLKTTL